MEYNDFIMAAFLAASISITAFMDTPVKPTLKQFFALITEKTRYTISDELRHIVYQVVAFVIALMFVLTVDKLSFAKLWYVVIEDKYIWCDQVISALILACNGKVFNWVIKGIQNNGALFVDRLKLKVEPPTPPSE